MRTNMFWLAAIVAATFTLACERVDGPDRHHGEKTPVVRLGDVAMLLSEIPLGEGQMGEVFDAVSGSTDNGYDEEYTMQDLFRDPGAGVGTSSTPTRRMSAPVVPMESRPSARRAASMGLQTNPLCLMSVVRRQPEC